MRILFWHRYLLSGTGSNVYTANLARVFREQGHDVLLLCQDRAAAQLSFVDADGDFTPDNATFHLRETGVPPSAGRVTVLRPDIANLLPTFIDSRAPGFDVKAFVDLSDDELGNYVTTNVRALRTALEFHDPDVVFVGHEVMGPYIAHEACRATGHEFAALLHGSGLTYAAKRQARYAHYARVGLSAAKVVVGGSTDIVRTALAAVGPLDTRTAVVNPGCDLELFQPADRSVAKGKRAELGFVGRIVTSKGAQNVIAALGLTRVPGLRASIVGYGAMEPTTRELADAIATKDVPRVHQCAQRLEHGYAHRHLSGFFAGDRADDSYFARASSVPVTWLGRLDHAALAPVLPTFDVLVVPSIDPESFGMVATEAAVAGVFPVVPAHSGLGEIGATIERDLGTPALLTYDPAYPIEGIAQCVDSLLLMPDAERAELRRRMTEVARGRWHWHGAAERLLAEAAR